MLLPQLLPMLAVPAEPFDDPAYHFEIKWDGIRALAAVDTAGWRLWGRDRADYTARYPELAVLRRLPAGTLVDGELVSFRAGLPDLAWLLRRHPMGNPWQVGQAWRWCPVHYVLFDLLYLRGRCLSREPLVRRQEMLAEVVATRAAPELMQSPSMVGCGRAFFAAVVAQGHEGVVAKHGQAPYQAGRRSPAWRKIKPPAAAPRTTREIQAELPGGRSALPVTVPVLLAPANGAGPLVNPKEREQCSMATKKIAKIRSTAKKSKNPPRRNRKVEPAATPTPQTTAAPLPEKPPVAAPAAVAVAEPTMPAPSPAEASPQVTAGLAPAKLSAIDAAIRILGEAGQPLSCPEMIAAMTARGYWTSPGGKTPASTLYSSILRELKLKGERARFRKTARGKFSLHVPA